MPNLASRDELRYRGQLGRRASSSFFASFRSGKRRSAMSSIKPADFITRSKLMGRGARVRFQVSG